MLARWSRSSCPFWKSRPRRGVFGGKPYPLVVAMLTILWDNDGVLVDTEGLYFRATRTVLAEVGVELTPEQFKEISLKRGESTFSLAGEQGILLMRSFASGPSVTGFIPTSYERSRALSTGRRSPAGLARPSPDGRLTSTHRQHFEIAHARSGLAKYLDFVVAHGDYQHSKPHPEPYLTALLGTNCGLKSASWSRIPSEGWRRQRQPDWNA